MLKTIILPGYSVSNKEWAEKAALDLNNNGTTAIVHYWGHWVSGLSLNLKMEINNIEKETAGRVNIIAKSVGTMVIAKYLEKYPNSIEKLILCGIPSISKVRLEIFKRVFSTIKSENLIVFQNVGDPFSGYSDVKLFFKKINPNIKVLKKDRSDHNYPYFDEFVNFLAI